MKLNNLNEVEGFINTLDKCNGSVWLESPDGDRINLKSKLSQFIGLGELLKQKLDLELYCSSAKDEALFYKFFGRILMLYKIKEWWTKFKQYYRNNSWVPGIFVICLLILAMITVATPTRLMYIKYYDKGVQLYEEKRYEEAIDIFSNLVDWRVGDRDGEEMYNKTLAKLNNITVNIYCPNCHQMIETNYLPLEERP